MKFALLLAGCGQYDGSETQEVILTLLSLSQAKLAWEAFAPDIAQSYVTNHLTNEREEQETRQVLKESARLVRGKIRPIEEAVLADYDAIVIPGGFGVVHHLCNWYTAGKDFCFHPQVKCFLEQAVQLNKPMGFICIAPIMIAKLFPGGRLTLGNDPDLLRQIAQMGALHVPCAVTDIVVDEQHRLVSTPANMLPASIDQVYTGIYKLVMALKKLAVTS